MVEMWFFLQNGSRTGFCSFRLLILDLTIPQIFHRSSKYHFFIYLCFREKITKTFNLSKGLVIYDPDVKAKDMSFSDHLKWKTGPHNRTHGITPQATCAVVGCGGILLNSCCGKEIDTHDFVIRTNFPDLEGFEPDVGIKQNITTINRAGTYTLAKEIRKDEVRQKLKNLNGSILFLPKGGPVLSKYSQVIRASQSMSVHFQVAYSSVSAAAYTDRYVWVLLLYVIPNWYCLGYWLCISYRSGPRIGFSRFCATFNLVTLSDYDNFWNIKRR